MRKRILCIMLTLCMVLAFMPQTAFATSSSGSCGTNLTWTLDDNGTLTITGTGAMYDWSNNYDLPWNSNCSSINTIVVDYGVTSIGKTAFANCTSLTSVTIPDSVTSIGMGAFVGCTGLTGVTIPDSVKSIGNSAFSGCTGLTSITIPDSVTSIGQGTFRGCTGLKSVTIPDSVTYIGSSAFRGCKGLTNVTIPSSVTTIETEAFYDCTGLTSVTIPSSVTTIERSTFVNCTSLTSVTIPNSVTSIKDATFQRCTNLTSVTIPDSVISIGGYTFYKCTGLTKIEIPDSVTSIGNAAFSGCTGLTSVMIPNSVPSIGEDVFDGCTSLESIFLSDKVSSIGIAAIPDTTSQIKYSLDTNKGEVTITEITLGTDKTSVFIPAEICGHSVVAVAYGLLGNISSHTCVGGQATCQTKATCGICGNEYGEIDSTNHNLEKISAKDATVTETGNKEYWHCKDCGKYFSDENGKSEIIDLAAWKAGEGKLAKLPPEIINGKGMSIAAGETKELTFRSNADFSDFIRVELDGKTLDAKYYTAKEGSTIITLKADYVASLSAGNHTIGIVSTSGTATTEFTVNVQTASENGSPKTGDNSNLLLWLALMILGASGTAGASVYSKKKRTNE